MISNDFSVFLKFTHLMNPYGAVVFACNFTHVDSTDWVVSSS